MPVRSGKRFIEDLRKRPREVWLRGERVHDDGAHALRVREARHAAEYG